MFDNDAGDVAVGLGNAEKARDGAPAQLPEPLQLPSGIEIGGLDADIDHVAPGGGNSATSWAPKKLSPGPACSRSTAARMRPWSDSRLRSGPPRSDHPLRRHSTENGRASCRERECQSVSN